MEDSPHELFSVDEVFLIAGRVVLAGRVLKGYVSVDDLLEAPDGRLLRVDGIESGRRKVSTVTAGQAAELIVSGVGWRPGRRDLEAYKASRAMEEAWREALSRLTGIPQEAAERAAESEVKARLGEILERHALKAYKPSQRV